MTMIRPFCGIHPAPSLAAAIAALPYDVYHRAEATEIVQKNPYSFLKIDRAETQFPPDTDMYSEEVYCRARDTFHAMLSDGSFVQDDTQCFYLYALTMENRTQTGIVGCASIDDYLNSTIRKHENTRAEKELDRIRHIDTLNAQTGPIFLAYRRNPELHQIIRQYKCTHPLFDFVSEDGIRHQIWKIADKNESFNYFLSVLFPADELKIYDYNRIVEDRNGYSTNELLAALQKDFHITENKCAVSKGSFSMYCDGIWYQLTAKQHLYTSDPVNDLDVSILQNAILQPLLGIEDPKTDSRIQFVGGIYGLKKLIQLVDEKPERLAFAMHPTSMDELFTVADANRLMPPKSTWFEPKLRSGLFIHKIEN